MYKFSLTTLSLLCCLVSPMLSAEDQDAVMTQLIGFEWRASDYDWTGAATSLERVSLDASHPLFIRKRALAALALTDRRKAAESLSRLVAAETPDSLRRRAIDLLCGLGTDPSRIKAPLLTALESDDTQTRHRAAVCLVELSDDEQISEALEAYLVRASDWERQAIE